MHGIQWIADCDCGKNIHLCVIRDDAERYYVRCMACDAKGPVSADMVDAVRKWNKVQA